MVQDTKRTIVRKWSIVQVFVASGGSNCLPLWALLAPKDRIGRKTQSFVLLAWRERLSGGWLWEGEVDFHSCVTAMIMIEVVWSS